MATSPLQRRLRSLWKGLCCGLGSGLLLWQGVAQADSVEFNVSTLLAGRADPRDGEIHTVVPVYQSLGVLATIKRPYFDSINIVMSGWGSVQLDIGRDQYWSGDIDLGYCIRDLASRPTAVCQ